MIKIDLEKKFNELCEKSNLVGASAVIVKGNDIVESFEYGYCDRENNKKMNIDTIIRIASVSKIEVALCLMMLEEEGKIDLDEDISTYLGFKVRNPLYPNDKITIRMIMTQTSSISDGLEIYKEDGDIFSGYNLLLEEGIKEPIEELLREDGKYYHDSFSKYKPGEHFEYANFGCGTLACILERVTGEYFVDFFKERVAKKLGIKASFMGSDFDKEELSCSYFGDGSLCRTSQSWVERSITKRPLGQNYVGPAGGLFISMRDLSLIMRQYMHDGGKLVSKETMDKMLEMNWYGDRCGDYSAKGLQLEILDVFDGMRLYGHFGTAYGIKTYLFFNPHQEIGMVFATCGGGFKILDCDISDVQYGLLESFLNNYWNKDLESVFTFTPGDEYGILDGRKIKIKYKENKRETLGKKPFLDDISYLDALQVSTYPGKTILSKYCSDKHLFSFIANLDNKYLYNSTIKEEKDGNDIKYHYTFTYKMDRDENPKYLKYNYHTHCDYCNHADGSVMDYLDMAYKAGYEMVGISDHGPLPNIYYYQDKKKEGYLSGQMDYDTFLNQYLKDIEEGKKKYQGKMDVLSSIEIEYFSGHDEYYKELRSHVDYLLMGEHYNEVDGKVVDAYFTCNYENVIGYAKCIEEGLNTGLFKCIAHPDIFMFKYKSKEGLLRHFDENAKKASRIIIEAAIKNNVYLEFNAGGLGRGKNINEDGSVEYAYPRSEFWDIVKEYKDAKVIIGCDAHSPSALCNTNIEMTIKLAKKWNLNVLNLK